ncbi:MAG: hypothetical protein J4415_00720 [Candidatus Diapherotrites archaeon]|uniref:Uncharacterized protein n=1 Tax=Candidatus Iainarchaeum sp. TaxID=3101447 RepID=A0A8T4KUB5_9ARCH|nr:hypothetical protein [Candidatus Diapherotrites archaeon]
MSTMRSIAVVKNAKLAMSDVNKLIDVLVGVDGYSIFDISFESKDHKEYIEGKLEKINKDQKGNLPSLLDFVQKYISKPGWVSFSYNSPEGFDFAITIKNEMDFFEISLDASLLTQKTYDEMIKLVKMTYLELGCSFGYYFEAETFAHHKLFPDIKEICRTNEVKRLYYVNFWNSKIVKNIGKERIAAVKTLEPSCNVETLKDGSILLALPLELHNESFVGFHAGESIANHLHLKYF